MHPNAAFRFPESAPALAFVAQVGFAHLFGMTPAGPRVAHVPLLVMPSGALRFHLANSNALAPHLDDFFETIDLPVLSVRYHTAKSLSTQRLPTLSTLFRGSWTIS